MDVAGVPGLFLIALVTSSVTMTSTASLQTAEARRSSRAVLR